MTIKTDSPARKALGGDCDTFTGVALREAPPKKLDIYVTGGNSCTTGKVEVPSDEVATIPSLLATPSPTASKNS